MPSGIEVARAYVTIIPKSDGTSTEVIDSIVNPLQESVGKAGDEAGGLFNLNLGKILGKFAVPAAIGTALVGIGKLGYDAFTEVEEGTMNVIKATGATGDAAKELENVYKNVASNVVGDFGDIGAAVGEVNTRFGLNGDELQGLSEQYMKFAKVNGVDVTNSIDQTQKALTAFGQDADAAPALLDAMTRAGQATGVSMETLQNGLVNNAAAFQELGMDIGQSTDFLAQLEMSGANSSAVMTGLRKAMKNAAADGVSFDDALAQLQDSILNGEDGMDGLTAAYDLFGKSGDQIYNAVKNGSIDFKTLTKSVNDSGGALDEVYNNTLTSSEKMDLAMQNIKIAGADLFAPIMTSASEVLTNTVIPLAQSAMGAVSAFMENVGTYYDEHIAPVVSAVSAEVVPVVDSVVSNVQTGVGAVGDVVRQVMPYIQNTVQTVWPVVQSVISTAVGVIKTVVPPVFNTVRSIISSVMSVVLGIIRSVWPTISSTVSKAVNTVKSVISGISAVVGRVRSTFNSIKSAMTSPLETAKSTISGIVSRIKGLFPLSIGKIFSNLKIPHISVSGGTAPFGIGGKGSLPSFSVNWYAKGAVFDDPSLVGIAEAGKEAVVPLEGRHMRPFAKTIAEEMEPSGPTTIIINTTIDGTTVTPEEYADRLVRELKLKVRTA